MHSAWTLLMLMVSAGQAPAATDEADERLAMLVESVGGYSITSRPEEGDALKLELHPTPLMRFDNQVGGVLDGVVMMWTAGERPAVVVQAFVLKDGVKLHEFQSMATTSLDLREQDVSRWSPDDAGIRFQEFSDAAIPARTPARRLIQMKAIAQQFSVTEDFRNNSGDEQTQQYRIRLQSNPVHRYRDETGGLIDGAMFAFVHGTDPEAFLLIEATQTEDGPAWRYAFAPMTCWALQAELDGRDVWTCPEQLGKHHARGVYHIWSFGEG